MLEFVSVTKTKKVMASPALTSKFVPVVTPSENSMMMSLKALPLLKNPIVIETARKMKRFFIVQAGKARSWMMGTLAIEAVEV